MAAVGHFGCLKFTSDRTSGYFRSIWILFYFFIFFTKWPPADILDVQKSLLIAFLGISDRSAILDVWNSLSIAILAISDRYRICFFRRPFWMSENHFWLHFWSICHFGCPKFTFYGISGHFISIHNFFFNFLTKWLPAAILDGTTMSIIKLVRDIWMSNAKLCQVWRILQKLSRWQRNCDAAAANHAEAALLTKT